MRDPRNNPHEAERVFLFRLAKDLSMTVGDLEARMTTREFAEWAAYYAALRQAEEAEQKKAAGRARKRR